MQTAKGCFVLTTISDYKVEIRTVLFYSEGEVEALKHKYSLSGDRYIDVRKYDFYQLNTPQLLNDDVACEGVVLHYLGEDPVYLMTIKAAQSAVNLYGNCCDIYYAKQDKTFDFHKAKEEGYWQQFCDSLKPKL